MEYFEFIINSIYDLLEDFFKSFTMVSGKATLRVLYFTTMYLFIAILSRVINKFSFVDVWSALLAFIIMFVINAISVIQKKDIDNFKRLLKGDECDE